MLPRYRYGSVLILINPVVYRVFRFLQPAPGDALVVRQSTFDPIVKTMVKKDRNGLFWLRGEKRAYANTSNITGVGAAQVIGKVLMAFQPAHSSDHPLKLKRASF